MPRLTAEEFKIWALDFKKRVLGKTSDTLESSAEIVSTAFLYIVCRAAEDSGIDITNQVDPYKSFTVLNKQDQNLMKECMNMCQRRHTDPGLLIVKESSPPFNIYAARYFEGMLLCHIYPMGTENREIDRCIRHELMTRELN